MIPERHNELDVSQRETDPVLDTDRLAEISRLDLFSAAAQSKLNAFARQAAERFDLPIGLVSIVMDGSQYFAGKHGLTGWLDEVGGTPVEWAFCATTVRTRRPYSVADATTDADQATNPLVVNDYITSYAGAPLITSGGHVVGSYCVIGNTQRIFTEAEMLELQQMAAQVMAEVEG